MKKNFNSVETIAEESMHMVEDRSNGSDNFWAKELEALPKPPSSL